MISILEDRPVEMDAPPQKNCRRGLLLSSEYLYCSFFSRSTISILEDRPVEMDVPPLKMLRTKQFYLVWLLFLFGGMGGVFMASMYKVRA